MSIYPSTAEQTDFAYNLTHYIGTVFAAAMVHERGWWLPLFVVFAWCGVYYYFFHVRPALMGLDNLSQEELDRLQLQQFIDGGGPDPDVKKALQQNRELKRRIDSLERALDEGA